jgi:hypothetical protein
MFAKEISNKLKSMLYVVESGIDNIRKMIRDCYTIQNPVLYLIENGDNLSGEAKNALLKVTEEPPNKAYIIMCLESANNTLETIRSRAVMYNMQSYTSEQILTYFHENYDISDWDDEDVPKIKGIIKSLCETPGEVSLLMENGVLELNDYVEKLVNNVLKVGWANVFKSSSKICLKKDGEGFDLKLFWKMFMTICMNRMVAGNVMDVIVYAKMVSTTSKALQELGIRGISKQMLFDNWLIELRKI